MKIVIIIYLVFQQCSAGYLQTEMVVDILRSFSQSPTVVANMCWTFKQKQNLMKNIIRSQLSIRFMVEYLPPLPYYTLDENILYLVDLKCNGSYDFLHEANALNKFRRPLRWILLAESTDTVLNKIEHLNILADSNVILATYVDINTYKLQFVYKISYGGQWRFETYGVWDSHNKLQMIEREDSLVARRNDLQGHEISVCFVILNNNSINHLEDRADPESDTITKVNYHIINNLLDYMNASRRYTFTNSWGYKVNGSWNGMTDYLLRRDADIGGTPIFVTAERLSLIDFVSSPTPSTMKFVFQQPNLSYENNLFLLSFRTTVWYSFLSLIILLSVLLLVVAIWEWRKMKCDSENPTTDMILNANVSDIVLLVIGAACQQGSSVELRGISGRAVMLILYLTFMFLFTSYSANIVALLQSSSSNIKTLENLLHSRIECGVIDTVYSRYYFSTATEPVRKAIYDKKIAPPGVKPRFYSMEEGIQRMHNGMFAFHMGTGVGYKLVAKYFLESEKCRLKEIQYLQVTYPWTPCSKNSPYRDLFKVGMRRVHEHGLQVRENLLLYANKPKCTGQTASFVSVSMIDCYPVLLVLLYGVLFSILILGFEILYHRRQRYVKKMCGRMKNTKDF